MANAQGLFIAILALDAYNRGYDVGMNVSGSQLGAATLEADSSAIPGSQDAPWIASLRSQ
jgi:hypothetical protein